MTFPLFDHQKKSVDFMRTRERVLDASDPGTGKTRVQIELFAERRRNGGGCALVIAPKSLLRSAWENDFAKFAPHITVSVAQAKGRAQAFARPADVYVTNVDATKWLMEQRPGFFARFDTLIMDELSAFKHHTSLRSKALNKIKGHFKYRYGLTGTPNSNGITDIWNQIYILDDGQRLGKSFYKFRNMTQTPSQAGPAANMLKWEDKPGAEQAVGELIKDMTVRHKFEECLDVPKNFETEVPFFMPPGQATVYKTFKRDALLALESGEVISSVNAAGVANKLLQIASGATYTGDANKYAVVDPSRYEMIADLVEARQHSVVFFHWRHQRDLLMEEFTKRGITFAVIDGSVKEQDRMEAVKDYQNGFYRVMLAHPASAAHGLTLTRGTTTIWASPTYNLEHWLQGNRRTYRAGQTQRTETISILAKGTIEELVYQRLADKNVKQINILELLNSAFKQVTP